jgi:hypothetical protein
MRRSALAFLAPHPLEKHLVSDVRTDHAVRPALASDALVRSPPSGVAFTGNCLWVAGSHGPKGKHAKPDRDDADNARLLAKVALEIAVEARGEQMRLAPRDDSGTLIRKRLVQVDGLGMRDLHLSDDGLHILAGTTMVLNGNTRVFKWPAAQPLLAANREPARLGAALPEPVPLPHGHGTRRAVMEIVRPGLFQLRGRIGRRGTGSCGRIAS